MESENFDMEKNVFDIKNEPMPKGAWWWWFWLFFFNNPKNPGKPRQLMILWSTKNEKEIECNGMKIKISSLDDRSNMEGAVAAWYFDGDKMHHNFLLDRCILKIAEGIATDSSTPTSFTMNRGNSKIKIGENFEFNTKPQNTHPFNSPIYSSRNYFRSKGYSIIKHNRLELAGKINNEPIHGTAYFQRVFVNSLSPSWYWGIFHFENGALLTYFNPYIFGKKIKKDIGFFDGKYLHKFKKINVKKSEGNFLVSSENKEKKIKFTVVPYSHSSWTFKKKFLHLPNKLVYNEYPATISDLELEDKKTGEKTTGFGKAIGNAEHTTGFLF